LSQRDDAPVEHKIHAQSLVAVSPQIYWSGFGAFEVCLTMFGEDGALKRNSSLQMPLRLRRINHFS
jgi:hypothetical protein